MKKLVPPEIDDNQVITTLSTQTGLNKTSYPHLKNSLNSILIAYEDYIDKNGDALEISTLPISEDLKTGLLKNYKNPPKVLKFIESLRSSPSTVCPMCGSLALPGTLDHYLPKETNPEFAVFSKNLIPACDCNNKRGITLKDELNHVRILHPYFDECLDNRLLSCRFTEVNAFPNADVDLVHLISDASVSFHINNIIERTGIKKWLEAKWSSLSESPTTVIHTIPLKTIKDENELRSYLDDALSRYDDVNKSYNNWESVFVHGLIHSPGVISWMLRKHNQAY
jgi:hypothetical protein